MPSSKDSTGRIQATRFSTLGLCSLFRLACSTTSIITHWLTSSSTGSQRNSVWPAKAAGRMGSKMTKEDKISLPLWRASISFITHSPFSCESHSITSSSTEVFSW